MIFNDLERQTHKLTYAYTVYTCMQRPNYYYYTMNVNVNVKSQSQSQRQRVDSVPMHVGNRYM